MKENSTEEDIKLLEEFSNENVLYGSMVGMTLEKYKDLQLSTEHILSDYKRVLKDNEELKNIELKSKGGAIKISLDGVLSLENKIKQLEKENKELKLYNNSITSQLEQMTTEKFKNGYFHQSEFKDSIPVKKIKDKIEELKINLVNMQGEELLIYESKIDVLQELLEGRK